MTETLAQIRARIERESRKALDLQWACGLRDELGNWLHQAAKLSPAPSKSLPSTRG